MDIIAHIYNDLTTKFGAARQSGLVPHLLSRIVFTPEYRNADALRGLEGFSHIWLLWDFSEAHTTAWRPTVRPPRLGGNQRMGVFATRSPFRPNNIGLSSVRLERIELDTPEGSVLHVSGADLMNGTPIWDIKPYLPYTDCHADATGGFAQQFVDVPPLAVNVSPEVLALLDERQLQALVETLQADPRPQYHDDPTRPYHILYAGHDLSFTVGDGVVNVILSVPRPC